MLRSVAPQAMPEIESIDDMLQEVDAALQLQGLVDEGDESVIVAGAPVNQQRPTNMFLLHRVGEI